MRKILFFFFFLVFVSGYTQENAPWKEHFIKGVDFQYQNRDSAYFHLKKAIIGADSTNNVGYIMWGHIYLLDTNGIYYDLNSFGENLSNMERILECDKRFYQNPHKSYYQYYLSLYKGIYLYKLSRYPKAETVFLKLYRDLQESPNTNTTYFSRLSSVQNWLGAIYLETGKYRLAKEYYQKSINMSMKNMDKGKTINAKSLLLTVLQKTGEYKETEKLLIEIIEFYKTQNQEKNHNRLISNYRLLTENYLKQSLPEKSLSVAREAEKLISDMENPRYRMFNQKYKARAYAQKKDFETALKFYQKALESALEYRNTPTHPDIAEIYSEMGTLFADEGKFDESLLYFQKALSSLSKNFNSEKASESPNPTTTFSKLTLISVLKDKSEVLSMAYHATSNLEYLESGNQTGKAIVQTLDLLKPEFESKVDFQFLLEEVFPAFDRMVNTAWILYDKTGKQNYLEDAFFFSEKSRAVFLLAAVQKTRATEFSGVPDSIVAREQHFKSRINHLEKQAFKNPGDKETQSRLFDLKNDYRFFLKEIQTQYPAYHKLKFASKVAGLSEIRDLLKQNQVLLDYYLTENELFVFSIDKEKTKFERLELTEAFSGKINALREGFSKPDHTTPEKLKNLSAWVYQQILPGLDKNTSELIVLRHGILNYIPFGALYNKPTEEYLIEKYAISYANSASLYKEHARKKIVVNPKILAFAPNFSAKAQGQISERDSNAAFGDLLYNKKEVRLIGNYFDTDILLDKAASLNAFKTKAEDYGILHFATHARINGNFPDYSCLAFSPADSTNLLYIKDLYSYHLNSELVVLSACETGTGKLQKGAGMLSIARGFNYAGANSLVTTQWEINDRSTADLMGAFYENLSEGQAKNTALRNAKLDYLEKTDDAMLRHPYFWASFVLTGNTAPVVETSSWGWWVAGILLILIVGGIGLRKKIKLDPEINSG